MALRLRKPVDFIGCWQRHVSQQRRNPNEGQDYENYLYGFRRWNGAYWVHR
jgi:hypothetical protein